jgi:hypothetical protein
MGIVGEGQGEGGRCLMWMLNRSGYLLISQSSSLSGDDDLTKLSGLSLSLSLISSWLLWGGVGKEAGTSTVLEAWLRDRSSSPFCFKPATRFTAIMKYITINDTIR